MSLPSLAARTAAESTVKYPNYVADGVPGRFITHLFEEGFQ